MMKKGRAACPARASFDARRTNETTARARRAPLINLQTVINAVDGREFMAASACGEVLRQRARGFRHPIGQVSSAVSTRKPLALHS
jgi:hypothetical protein